MQVHDAAENPVQQYLYSILIVALALPRIIPSRKSHNLVLSLRPPCSCPLPPTFQGNGRGHGKLLPRLLEGTHYGELALWRGELSFEYYSSWKICILLGTGDNFPALSYSSSTRDLGQGSTAVSCAL